MIWALSVLPGTVIHLHFFFPCTHFLCVFFYHLSVNILYYIHVFLLSLAKNDLKAMFRYVHIYIRKRILLRCDRWRCTSEATGKPLIVFPFQLYSAALALQHLQVVPDGIRKDNVGPLSRERDRLLKSLKVEFDIVAAFTQRFWQYLTPVQFRHGVWARPYQSALLSNRGTDIFEMSPVF